MKKTKKEVLCKITEEEMEVFDMLDCQKQGLIELIGLVKLRTNKNWGRLQKKYKIKDEALDLNRETREVTKLF